MHLRFCTRLCCFRCLYFPISSQTGAVFLVSTLSRCACCRPSSALACLCPVSLCFFAIFSSSYSHFFVVSLVFSAVPFLLVYSHCHLTVRLLMRYHMDSLFSVSLPRGCTTSVFACPGTMLALLVLGCLDLLWFCCWRGRTTSPNPELGLASCSVFSCSCALLYF